jgi:tocopherol O-methyltransferase
MATSAEIREHYDSLAFIYQTFWGDHIHHGLFARGDETAEAAQVALVDHCAALLSRDQQFKLAGAKVLDVGCGHGGTAIHLAQKWGCEVVGITLSEKQARIARQNSARAGRSGDPTFLVQDAEGFHYPPAEFDLVWTMEASEHFADKTWYFDNAARALRRGGRLLLAAWTGSMQDAEVRAVAKAFLCPQLWTATQYGEAIEQAGMTIIEEQDVTATVVRTWEICRERARLARATVALLSRKAREFVEGIDVILDAYRSSKLRYTVLVAAKAPDFHVNQL